MPNSKVPPPSLITAVTGGLNNHIAASPSNITAIYDGNSWKNKGVVDVDGYKIPLSPMLVALMDNAPLVAAKQFARIDSIKYAPTIRRLMGERPSPDDLSIVTRNFRSNVVFSFNEYLVLMSRSTIEETVAMLTYMLDKNEKVYHDLIRTSPHYYTDDVQNLLTCMKLVDLLMEDKILDSLFDDLFD